MAGKECKIEVLKHLINDVDFDINFMTEDGWTALHLAIDNDNKMQSLNCIKYLLEAGADVNWLV